MVASGIVNSGVLWANGATLTVQGAVSGNGTATIDGIGTLDFEASTSANVVFGSGTGGTLKLGNSFHFNGTISEFGGSDVIDLANVAAATRQSAIMRIPREPAERWQFRMESKRSSCPCSALFG